MMATPYFPLLYKQASFTMNKVWTIEYIYYDDHDLVGIFDSEQKAREVLATCPEWLKKHADVYDYELNKARY